MEPSIGVRRALPGDLPAVECIVDEYCEAIGVLIRDDKRQLEQYLDENSGMWLASNAGDVVGCVAMRPLSTRQEACEIKRLYVRKSFRGMAVADALMDALEEYAAGRRYRWAYLDTKDDLRAAIRFYERRGYVVCERYNKNPQATLFMRRQLG